MCVFRCCILFFFFKQKTAYEMRISDWSSDVCSSDLGRGDLPAGCTGGQRDQQADGHAGPGVAQDAKCHAQYSSLRWERQGAVARAFVDLRPEVEEPGDDQREIGRAQV